MLRVTRENYIKKRTKGFTLPEILVVCVVTSLVLGVMFYTIITILNNFKISAIRQENRQATRVVLTQIEKELKAATVVLGDIHIDAAVQAPDANTEKANELIFAAPLKKGAAGDIGKFNFRDAYRQIHYRVSADKKSVEKTVCGLADDGKPDLNNIILRKNIVFVPQTEAGEVIFTVSHALLNPAFPFDKRINTYDPKLFNVKIEVKRNYKNKDITDEESITVKIE